MIKLYDIERSGNCYKIRLLLAMLGLEYRKIAVVTERSEHKTDGFLQLNPRGQLPVLEDDGLVLWDSSAILTYLALRYGKGSWVPEEDYGLASVMQWLAFEQNEIRYGLARARAILLGLQNPFAQLGNLDECHYFAKAALTVLETRLRGTAWLVGERATIADVACYPYVALAPEADVAMTPYPAVKKWLGRIECLPGYIPLPRAGKEVRDTSRHRHASRDN